MLPHGSVTSHVTTTRSWSSFKYRLPDMRGLKKTHIAGRVLTRLAAPLVNGSKRPMETPPSSPRGLKPGPAPSAGALLSGVNRIDPVTPTENEFHILPEKGNEKLCNVT